MAWKLAVAFLIGVAFGAMWQAARPLGDEYAIPWGDEYTIRSKPHAKLY